MLEKGHLYYLFKERLCTMFKEFVFLKLADKLRTSSPTAITVLGFITYWLPLFPTNYLTGLLCHNHFTTGSSSCG